VTSFMYGIGGALSRMKMLELKVWNDVVIIFLGLFVLLFIINDLA